MKKSKILYIITIILIFFFTLFNALKYKSDVNSNFNLNSKGIYQDCQSLSVDDQLYKDYCFSFMEVYNHYLKCKNNLKDKECLKFVNRYELFDKSNKEIFYELLNTNYMMWISLFFLIIMILSSYDISHLCNNLVYKNYLNRISYNKFMKLIYKRLLKYLLIMPLFIIFNLVCMFLITKSIDISGIFTLRFILLYFVNLILQSLFYLNLVYLCAFGSKNFIVNFAKSVGIYIIIIYLCGLIDMIFRKCDIELGLNIFNLFYFSENKKLISIIAPSVLLVLVTSLVIYFVVRNKERTIIRIEKSEVEDDNQYK